MKKNKELQNGYLSILTKRRNLYNYLCSIIILLFFNFSSYSQEIKFSPAFFGPYAIPVPEFTDATISDLTILEFYGCHYLGFGDITNAVNIRAEIPLLPSRISMKVWYVVERFEVNQEIYKKRIMYENKYSGVEGGDFYIQTRMLILVEKRFLPNMILNSTLKTASGNNFNQRRFTNAPGYYFDLEIGKSIHFESKVLSEVRAVVDFGFICWQTKMNRQNDAPLYGGKIILSNRIFNFENGLSGYTGWMKNGDAPLVYNSTLNFKHPKFNLFTQYKYGINDFPYHQFQFGIGFKISALTPNYK